MSKKKEPSLPPGQDSRPGYILGLPDDDPEAATVSEKFEGMIDRLRRVYPKMEEARAIVKMTSLKGERKQYQVEVFLRLPGDRINFKEEAWSLTEAFEIVIHRLKRLMTKMESKPSYRRQKTRAEQGSETP